MEKRKHALTRAAANVAAALLVLFVVAGQPTCVQADATPRGVAYRNIDYFGHGWVDAEKSPTNYEDDLLCWAAAAANVLD